MFGLTREQLRPIVESIAGEQVRACDTAIEHEVPVEHYGGRGDKVVPTFTYETRSGQVGRAAVFVKRHCNPGPNEALHYEWLTKHLAPIPRIYGAISGPDVHDIIFIEYITPYIGDAESFMRDREKVRQFLATTARFNAIEPCEEYAAKLPCKLAHMGLEQCHSLLSAFWERANRGALGEALQRFCSSSALGRLTRLADQLPGMVGPMNTALSHWDHRPNNVGWRREAGEMVIFDLEDTTIGPRYDDLADWLGAPDDVQPRSEPRSALAGYYLDQVGLWGGPRKSVDEFLVETRVLWMAHVLRDLDWWMKYGGVLDGCDVPSREDPREWRSRNREKLLRELSGVLREVS